MIARLRTLVLSSAFALSALALGAVLVLLALLELFVKFVVDRVLYSIVYLMGRVFGLR